MTEGRWTPEAWEERGAAPTPPERLPRLEELPSAEHGYDRAAVQQAFEAFYRHAAQLDATLRVLESMDVFARQSKELRDDIRALRASAWGPVPAPRPAWSTESSERSYARAGSGVPEALPRLAVEAAFIVLVAIGAGLAELSATLIVLLVLGAFLLVALFELVASTRKARFRAGLVAAAPAPAAQAAVAAPVVEPDPVAPAPEATMIEPGPDLVEAAEPEPVVEPVPIAPAHEDPWEAPQVVALESAPEPEPEPESASVAFEDTMDELLEPAAEEAVSADPRLRRGRR